MTTKDLIRFLPLEESYREKLLADYDTMDDTKKFQIDVLMWSTYDKLHDVQLQQNLQLYWEKAGMGEEKLDSEFYKRVKNLTEQELASQFMTSHDEASLGEARAAMEKIVKEIRAAKLDKKAATAAKKAN